MYKFVIYFVLSLSISDLYSQEYPWRIAANRSLESGNISYSIPWADPEDEKKIRNVFAICSRIQSGNEDGEKLARDYFTLALETSYFNKISSISKNISLIEIRTRVTEVAAAMEQPSKAYPELQSLKDDTSQVSLFVQKFTSAVLDPKKVMDQSTGKPASNPFWDQPVAFTVLGILIILIIILRVVILYHHKQVLQ